MLLPLSFVIFVSMIKDISEDYKRHKSDRKENLSKVLIMDVETGEFKQHTWEEVQLGSVVKILENNYFPADLILVDSSEANGQCYVETKGLDGETNLKTRYTNKNCRFSVPPLGEINCEMPDEQIYKFDGTYQYKNGKASLGLENFLHRGSSLKNTEWVIGITVYTGHDTKVLKNSLKTHWKQSAVEKQTNKLIIIIF